MAAAKYYSPRLDRDLISSLYHAAKSRRLPMTRLASMFVREGLFRLEEGKADEDSRVREDSSNPECGAESH